MASYCTLTDQADVVRYLTVDATLAHTEAVLAAVTPAPTGLDLTPEAPYWLQLGGDSGNRYLYLDAVGVVTISESAPGIGTGLTRPQGLQLMDIWRYLWRVTLEPVSGDVSAWLVPGWVLSGWIPTGGSAYSLSLVQAGFEVHTPQGTTVQSWIGVR